MNTNETIRNASTDQANALNQVYSEIIETQTFNNFDINYYYPDYTAIIAKWVSDGHKASDLIEPVDGFHPSQSGNMLLSQAMWEFMGNTVPDAMGNPNPNNAAILQQFGDQGGYGL